MKISFNPSNSNKNILDLIKNNKDIIFDLKGHNIFARGVKFLGTDTNTWRDIKIVGKSIGSNTLDLYPGENIKFINNTFGKITIESTWRPVVNNLNSNSATKSLSAKQGNVLAELINTLTNNVSNNYALRDGSNATGHWQGGLACLDIRDINKNPGDLNQGLELHFFNNNTNNLEDGGIYNGVFSFRQWSSGSDWSGGKAHLLAFTDNGNMWHRTSALDSWGTWKKLAYATDIPSSLKNPYALTISLNGISQGPYDGSAVKDINITPGSIGASASGHNHDHKYLKWLGNAEQTNMNDIGRISHSSGMTALSDPGNTIDNPMEGNIKSTSWHLYWLTNYTDDPGGSNSWVALIVNKAGTDRWWVRSRSGGTITNGTNWSSNWRFLVTAPTSGLGSGNLPIYINNAGEVVIANSYPTSLPANGGNADTVDGEHASSFVRAGNYESLDLNNLDTYSFIKSVAANNISTSPNGRPGWYNIILAVHRNGAADGSNFIGQIALGMSASNNGMFYRIKDNGSWDNWKEVVTTNTGLLRYSRNNINISSSNCSPIPPSLLEWTIGYPRLYDPEFNDGYNGVLVYNNANNGVVTVTRVSDTNVGNSGNYVLKIVSAVGAVPHCGGWHVATLTELGKVYTCLFRANIPSGVLIDFNTNSIGTGGLWSWLTNSIGTGKWTWYAILVYCGSGGSTTFHFAAMSPCTWYLSYVNVIENNRASYAGLRSVYSDYLKANASIVFGRNELLYFNQYTSTTSGATNNANPTTDWYHILRMNHANSSGYFVDLVIPFNSNRILFRRIVGGLDVGWYRVITEEPNHNILLCDTQGNVGIGTSNPTQKLDVAGNIRASGQIVRESSELMWVNGRNGALLRETSAVNYHTLWSLKTIDGSWDFGEYNWDKNLKNVPILSYITDANFNSGNNEATYLIKFPLASGTVALTSDILSPTNYYWANVKISDSPSINTSPTVNTLTATRVCAGHDPGIDNSISCSGWFRSSGDTGWYNTTYRGGWYMSDTDWIRAHNNVGIYTGGQIYSSNSIRMGDIYLLNSNEINNTNSNLYINYRGTSSINMCHGGGSVIIGPQIGNVNNNKLYVNGAATIVGSTTLNSTATFNGLVYNNGGILPATCDFNNTGAGYSVWGDAMSTGVTAITDALDPTYVDVLYSLDSGTTWIDYALSDLDKFSLYANNGSSISIFLGNNGTSSLAQVLKNQSMVTFEIPNGLYSALCWASVDIGNGIKTVCTVEIINKNGTIIKTFTKTMIGWNKFNYINFWGIDNSITDIGSDLVRFVRFKFRHDTSNTNIRNAQIRKIRLFSFTKFYLDPSDFRSIMGNTGHIYKYDKNLNVTFPNIINCKTLDITNSIRVGNNLSIYSESGTKKLAQLDLSDILSIYTNIYLSKGLCVGLLGPALTSGVTTDDASAFIATTVSDSFIFTFKPALNGLLLFLKLLKSSATTKFMCATNNCRVVRSSDFSISINTNSAAEVFGDGRSRIFIYQSTYASWFEFYCG